MQAISRLDQQMSASENEFCKERVSEYWGTKWKTRLIGWLVGWLYLYTHNQSSLKVLRVVSNILSYPWLQSVKTRIHER